MEPSGSAQQIALGAILPLWSVIPFAGMLLSIALFPLFVPRFWHDHYGKVSLFWIIMFVVPFWAVYHGTAIHEMTRVVFAEYIPFILLLASLYIVSGGILVKGTLRGTPLSNTLVLATGTILASFMGTTGAAMLLIRPFLRSNAHRKNRVFMVVFFIFLVANIGGSLTPLGDPPLFLGFLKGVPFFWTFRLAPPMIIVAGILLLMYFLMDRYFHRKEGTIPLPSEGTFRHMKLEGGVNLLLLAGIIGAVLLSGLVRMGDQSVLGVPLDRSDLARDGILIVLSCLSLLFTSKGLREENEFSWMPIKEVAVLFAGIFMTMIPCLMILQSGTAGALAPLLTVVKEPYHYFWATGIFSGILDNAPAYMTFLNTAIGDFFPLGPAADAVAHLLREQPLYVEAISAGAVFFGAATYIGNAPNFMVRSIAEESGIPMPTFFGYMLKFSLILLFPVFILVTFLFFA
ncbi:MAG: sodium:proton antiporter [bacterium]